MPAHFTSIDVKVRFYLYVPTAAAASSRPQMTTMVDASNSNSFVEVFGVARWFVTGTTLPCSSSAGRCYYYYSSYSAAGRKNSTLTPRVVKAVAASVSIVPDEAPPPADCPDYSSLP